DRDGDAGKARRRGVRLAQMIHRVGRRERGVPIDMDEDTLSLSGGIGDPGDAFLDQLPGGRAPLLEIVGKRGESRVRHAIWPCYSLSGGSSISRSSSAELSDLPCASSAS